MGDDFDDDNNLQVNIANFDHVPYDEESIRRMFGYDEDAFLREFERVSCENLVYESPIFTQVGGRMALNIDEFTYHVSSIYLPHYRYPQLCISYKIKY